MHKGHKLPELEFYLYPRIAFQTGTELLPVLLIIKGHCPSNVGLPCASPRESQAGSYGTYQCHRISTGIDSEP